MKKIKLQTNSGELVCFAFIPLDLYPDVVTWGDRVFQCTFRHKMAIKQGKMDKYTETFSYAIAKVEEEKKFIVLKGASETVVKAGFMNTKELPVAITLDKRVFLLSESNEDEFAERTEYNEVTSALFEEGCEIRRPYAPAYGRALQDPEQK